MSFGGCWEWDRQKAEHKLIWSDVIYLIDKKTTYHHAPISTLVPVGANVWPYRKGADSKRRIRAMYNGMVPYHFAYIKFYTTKEGYGPFALVAGKTNLENPDFDFFTDIASTTKRGDKAKRFLKGWDPEDPKNPKDHRDSVGSWYCQMVLAVWDAAWNDEQEKDEFMEYSPRWSKQDQEARKVEGGIKNLLGLFSS